MLNINMIVKGEDVKGQGVGSAYKEIVNLIETHAKDDLHLSFNDDTNCDINHVHTVHPSCYMQMTTSNLPSCMHVHFLPETLEDSIKLPKLFQKTFYNYVLKMYKKANELVVVNPIFIDDLVSYGLNRDNITYIPNVVASTSFYPKEIHAEHPLREKFMAPKDKFNVLGVGQVQTRKGVLDFVEIAKLMPDVNFIWAGGFSFGKITDGYEKLEDMMNNPPNNVHFVGIIDREEMNDLYNMADCLLMTSYNELFPMAILEAINADIPLLLRDLDLYEKIYFTDYLRASNNEEFVKSLYQLRDDALVREKAISSSRKIASDYSEEHIAKLWIDYYNRIAKKWA